MTEAEQVEKRGGRPRSEDADRAIVEATLDLLADVGVGAVSIEGIAARAGVGKTTIYRRWPDKESVIIEAVASLKGPLPEPAGESVRDDLITLAEANARGAESVRGRKLYACFVGEMNRFPPLRERYNTTVVQPRRAVTANVLRRAIERGELRDDLDVETMVGIVTAPLVHWMLMHPDAGVTRELIEQLVDAALNGLRPRD